MTIVSLSLLFSSWPAALYNSLFLYILQCEVPHPWQPWLQFSSTRIFPVPHAIKCTSHHITFIGTKVWTLTSECSEALTSASKDVVQRVNITEYLVMLYFQQTWNDFQCRDNIVTSTENNELAGHGVAYSCWYWFYQMCTSTHIHLQAWTPLTWHWQSVHPHGNRAIINPTASVHPQPDEMTPDVVQHKGAMWEAPLQSPW